MTNNKFNIILFKKKNPIETHGGWLSIDLTIIEIAKLIHEISDFKSIQTLQIYNISTYIL